MIDACGARLVNRPFARSKAQLYAWIGRATVENHGSNSAPTQTGDQIGNDRAGASKEAIRHHQRRSKPKLGQQRREVGPRATAE